MLIADNFLRMLMILCCTGHTEDLRSNKRPSLPASDQMETKTRIPICMASLKVRRLGPMGVMVRNKRFTRFAAKLRLANSLNL